MHHIEYTDLGNLSAHSLSRPQFPEQFQKYIERDYGFLSEVKRSQCLTWRQVEERFNDAIQRWEQLPSRPLDAFGNRIGIPTDLCILRALVEWFESFHGDSNKIELYDDSGNLTSKVTVPDQLTDWYEKVNAAWAPDNSYSRADALALTNQIFNVLRSEGSVASLLLSNELIGNLKLLLSVHNRGLEGDAEMVQAITQSDKEQRTGVIKRLLKDFHEAVGNISLLPGYAIIIARQLGMKVFGGKVGEVLTETAQARQLKREQEFLAIYQALVHKLLGTPTLEFKVHGVKEQGDADAIEGVVSSMLVNSQHADEIWWGLGDLERSEQMGLETGYIIQSSWLSAKDAANEGITEITGRIKGLPSLLGKIRSYLESNSIKSLFPLPLDHWGICLQVKSVKDIYPTIQKLMELEFTHDDFHHLPEWVHASLKVLLKEGVTYHLARRGGGRVKVGPNQLNFNDLRVFSDYVMTPVTKLGLRLSFVLKLEKYTCKRWDPWERSSLLFGEPIFTCLF